MGAGHDKSRMMQHMSTHHTPTTSAHDIDRLLTPRQPVTRIASNNPTQAIINALTAAAHTDPRSDHNAFRRAAAVTLAPAVEYLHDDDTFNGQPATEYNTITAIAGALEVAGWKHSPSDWHDYLAGAVGSIAAALQLEAPLPAAHVDITAYINTDQE